MGDWIEWSGGNSRPVVGETLVEIELRSGVRTTGRTAYECDWRHLANDATQDIVAYRIAQPTNQE